MENNFGRKKIGLALGGGGAKGLAHIGIIKALEKADLPVHFIAGTSMGALVGSWYAVTRNIVFLENLFLKMARESVKSGDDIRNNLGDGLFKDKGLADFLKMEFGKKTFADCEIPFCAIATDVQSGLEVGIKEGNLVQAVQASVAIPLIFKPVKIGERILMDGAIANAVPADAVRKMGADYVIAVDVSSRWVNFYEDYGTRNSVEMIIRNAFSAIEYQVARRTLKEADAVLRPRVADFNVLDFPLADRIIEAGAKEARRNIVRIRRATGYLPREPVTLAEKLKELKDFINSR